MTQEEKQLLLKDLCGRLLYGVICEIYNEKCTIAEKLLIGGLSHFCDDTIYVKPYLRPMSSMTKEEHTYWDYVSSDSGWGITEGLITECVDWLNAHHFDYRGLIEMGLAIAVTKENNPYED